MADFDLSRPSPDAGHEGIRQAVVAAIEELTYNTDDVGLSLDLADTLFVLLAGLEARVAALEPPAPSP